LFTLDHRTLSCEIWPQKQIDHSTVWCRYYFGPPVCRGADTPDFGHILKSDSVLSMWPVLAEFRSASSEGSWGKDRQNIESW